jgi:hypothetical protein
MELSVQAKLKQFLPRLVVSLLVIGAATVYFIWQPYARARQVLLSEIERREANRTARLATQRAIKETPSPSSITVQAPGLVKSHAANIQKIADDAQSTQLIAPPRLPPVKRTPIPGLRALVAAVNQIIDDPLFGSRYHRTGEYLEHASSLLTYHAGIMAALANVLEYNPSIDFADFDI